MQLVPTYGVNLHAKILEEPDHRQAQPYHSLLPVSQGIGVCHASRSPFSLGWIHPPIFPGQIVYYFDGAIATSTSMVYLVV